MNVVSMTDGIVAGAAVLQEERRSTQRLAEHMPEVPHKKVR